MIMRSAWLFLAIFFWSVGTAAVARERSCFSPLANFADRDPTNFKDLEKPIAATPAKGVVRFEPVSSGRDQANIDFLYVKFTHPADVTPEQFFKSLRLAFPQFAKGDLSRFGFGPYEESSGLNDPVRLANSAKWRSDDPTGALMTFNLDSVWPFAGVIGSGTPGKKTGLTEKAGDVQVTCASGTDLIFSTVESGAGGMHPVAGNRRFGLMVSADGDWVFYSKAVDRDSKSLMNMLLRINPGEENIFCKGQSFWVSFYIEIRDYLKKRGLNVVDWNLKNHGPVAYPFQSGQQSVEQKCKADQVIIPKDSSQSALP